MSKVEIRTELLEQLNKSIAGKEDSFTLINKASTEEKTTDVKPAEIIGDAFNAKDWMGEPGDESDSTIAGCFNTIVKEMADFVEGIILVDEEEAEKDEDDGDHHYSGPTYTPPDTPTEETPEEETPEEETPEEEETEEEEGEEVTVTPVVIDPATLSGEFSTGDDTTSSNDGIGTSTVTTDGVIITNANGEQVGTTGMGQYKVYEQMTDENGNVLAVRISADGEEEQWIRINQNGTQVGTFYETNQVG